MVYTEKQPTQAEEVTASEPDTRSSADYPGLVAQIKEEYDQAWKHQQPKKKQWEVRLKLYNNQKRDPKAVGDTTLFTVMQTVLAALYDDRLMVAAGGREEGDDEQTDNIDAMAEFDYEEMEKDQLDYDWDFDAAFFGRGYVCMEEYIRDPDNNKFYPLPEVIDPIIFLRDPDAKSVNGRKDSGKGSARFMGYPVKMGRQDLKDIVHIFPNVKEGKGTALKYGTPTFSILQDAIDARNEAQNRASTKQFDNEAKLGANAQHEVLIWYTFYQPVDELGRPTDERPKRLKCWLCNDREELVGVQELKEDYWKIVDRPLYPTSHDFDGVSIPDLVEDKQRARAIVSNLVLNAMKADVYPMYIYDTNKVTNRKDLKFAFNKFIGVDAKGESVQNAVAPMQKARPNMGLIDFIYTTLDLSAQKATATPDIQQGIQSQVGRPLGETNILKTGVDTRYSLSAKVFGWSEKRFWQFWYLSYMDNFADGIDEKVLRLQGAFGAKWRPVSKKDFTTRISPDFTIESRAVNRAKELEERQSLTGYFQLVLADPTANRRYAMRKLGKLYGMKKDELDRLLPPTIDERIAEDENEQLNDNKFVGVLREDDHNVHLEMHSKAKDTPQAKAHIETHKKALMIKKTNPEFFPADPTATNFQDGQAPAGGAAISPLANRPVQPSQTSGAM
jgi:hypothetical protein